MKDEMIGIGMSDRTAAAQRIEDLESQLAAAKAEIEKLKADNENMLARPAMFDVLKLAKRDKRLREENEKLKLVCMCKK